MEGVLDDAAPEAVGLSASGLARVDRALADLIAEGRLAGAVTLVARYGKVAHRARLGCKDLGTGEALADDTIFRIYSMTKPVMAVAMMILHDRGLWSPDDPIARHLPAFAEVKGPDGAAPSHAPTMRELMTHTAGLSYGGERNDPTDTAYIAAKVWQAPDLAEMMCRLASAPLAYQPGERWRYSISMDVQGAVLETLTGRSLPDFMRDEIFAPLGMVDTDFFVPAGKLPRMAPLYLSTRSRGLVAMNPPLLGRDGRHIPALPSGGGGLYSTAGDYARLAQMLLNRGELGGVRILSPDAVATMTANHISEALMAGGFGVGHQQIRPGFGYGFNGAVFTDPPAAGSRVGRGTYQWDGAAGTWFWIDPEHDLLFVGMIQLLAPTRAPPLQAMTQALMADAIL